MKVYVCFEGMSAPEAVFLREAQAQAWLQAAPARACKVFDVPDPYSIPSVSDSQEAREAEKTGNEAKQALDDLLDAIMGADLALEIELGFTGPGPVTRALVAAGRFPSTWEAHLEIYGEECDEDDCDDEEPTAAAQPARGRDFIP